MSTKKKANPIHITPKGRSDWAKVFTPDTKFNPDGTYSCTLIFDNADAQDLMKLLDEKLEASIAKAAEEKGKPVNKIKFLEPYEVDDETGDVKVKFKMNAVGKDREGKTFTQKPAVFDAKRTPITKEIPLWNGSLMRIGFQTAPYFTTLVGAGVTLRLKQVQVITALAGGQAEAVFGEEEGYSYDEEDASPAAEGFQEEETSEEFDDIPF